jgi:hypothetical protein
MDLFLFLLIVKLIRNSLGTYFLFPEQVNFAQAIQKCSSKNATVVFIDNLTEDTYIKNTYLPLVTKGIWLAIYDIIGNETNVNYYTNRTLNYTNWVYDNRNDKCFRYEKNKQWLDISCGSLYSTLCEFSTVQTGFTVTNVTTSMTIPESSATYKTTIIQSLTIDTTQTDISASSIKNISTTVTLPESSTVHQTTTIQSPTIHTTQTTISVSNIMNIPLWNNWNPWSFCEFHRQRKNNKMANGIENEIINVSCSLVCKQLVFILYILIINNFNFSYN